MPLGCSEIYACSCSYITFFFLFEKQLTMVPCRCCQKTTLLILGVIMPFKVCQHNHYLWIVPYIFFFWESQLILGVNMPFWREVCQHNQYLGSALISFWGKSTDMLYSIFCEPLSACSIHSGKLCRTLLICIMSVMHLSDL